MVAQKKAEDKEVKERAAPSGRIVYKAVSHEGHSELERPTSALFWSGLAAGLSIAFSMITEGLLQSHLPNEPWRPLISKFGYSVGFLIVILGRQQLFTENTLTPILPLMKERTWEAFKNVMRLWIVVLVANTIGTLIMAFALMKTAVFDDRVRATFIELGHRAMSNGPGLALWKGVFAGWLIALMVWLLPFAEVARIWVIFLLTYIIGIGALTHVIAGSVVVFSLAAAGEKAWGTVITGFYLPVLAGNIIGGVTLVAALNHAQVVAGQASGDDL